MSKMKITGVILLLSSNLLLANVDFYHQRKSSLDDLLKKYAVWASPSSIREEKSLVDLRKKLKKETKVLEDFLTTAYLKNENAFKNASGLYYLNSSMELVDAKSGFEIKDYARILDGYTLFGLMLNNPNISFLKYFTSEDLPMLNTVLLTGMAYAGQFIISDSLTDSDKNYLSKTILIDVEGLEFSPSSWPTERIVESKFVPGFSLKVIIKNIENKAMSKKSTKSNCREFISAI